MLRICLLAAAVLASACNVVEAVKANDLRYDFKSSGTAKMENSLSQLALSVNGSFTTDGVAGAPTGEALASIRNFGETLARRFPSDFPELLTPYQVRIVPPGRGIPLLRLYLADGHSVCDDDRREVCQTKALLEGSLIGSDGQRAWWFSAWIDVTETSDKTYNDIYRHIVDAMATDQVVTRE